MAREFRLYEGLLWEPPKGYFLLEHHLQRLERSAAHFRFSLDLGAVRERLYEFSMGLPQWPRKVRLEVSAHGGIALEEEDVRPSTPVQVALADEPVDSSDEFLRHKTSRRGVFERALAAHPEAQDVLLWNERGELTETCSANVVLEIDGRRLTPHRCSGLLPGTFRRHLLERGEIEEEILSLDAIERATGLFSINSVRRWCEIRLFGS
jgi:branched-subunit amino acid aminotransferase/4-amino-4-deoxychorismate lyase